MEHPHSVPCSVQVAQGSIQNAIKHVRELSTSNLMVVFDLLIPSNLAPASSFWLAYSEAEVFIGKKACLFIWIITEYKVVPRDFQIQATIAMMTGKDCLIDVGTGYGKTLCMILPCLFAPKDVAIIFSPLKRLQAVHVLEFMKYGIETIAINEDTPNNPNLWKVLDTKLIPSHER